MLKSAISLAVVLTVATVYAQNKNLDMFGLINVLYTQADPNMDYTVTEAEMARIYSVMDQNNDSKIALDEFTHIWKLLTYYNDEMCDAYFRLADVDRNGEIDSKDNDMVYHIFDLNGDGVVSSVEFDDEYQQVYHRVPFVVLFRRTDIANDNNNRLTKDQFSKLFSSLSVEADGSITQANIQKDWQSNNWGTAADALAVFTSLDGDKSGSVSVAEMEGQFSTLDKSGDGLIEITEVEVMGDVDAIV